MNEDELKHMNQMIGDTIVKIDEKIGKLSETIGKTIEKKKEYAEGKINENTVAYMAGAFFGGVIVGYVIGRKKCNGEDIEKVK
jgi:hypothetical protein